MNRSIAMTQTGIDAVDRSLEANREVERARAALERESTRSLRLYGIPKNPPNAHDKW